MCAVVLWVFLFLIEFCRRRRETHEHYQKTTTSTTTRENEDVVSREVLTPSKSRVLTMEQVAQHTSADSCWVLLGNNVYDVTRHLETHKAGAASILKYAGQVR